MESLFVSLKAFVAFIVVVSVLFLFFFIVIIIGFVMMIFIELLFKCLVFEDI